MVVDCPKCGEHAYATRFKDSFESVCRACRYYHIAVSNVEGYDLDFEITGRDEDLDTDYEYQRPNPKASGTMDEIEVFRCTGCETHVHPIASLVGNVWSCECTVHRRTTRRGVPAHWTLESFENTVGREE